MPQSSAPTPTDLFDHLPCGAAQRDGSGRVRYVNPAGAALLSDLFPAEQPVPALARLLALRPHVPDSRVPDERLVRCREQTLVLREVIFEAGQNVVLFWPANAPAAAHQDASRELGEELLAVLDSSYDEIFITDGSGRVLRVTGNCEQLYGMQPEELVGRHVQELEKDAIFSPSATLEAIENRRQVVTFQETRSGRRLVVTATPVFHRDDPREVIRVVSTARDITELTVLREQVQEAQRRLDAYRRELAALQLREHGDGQPIVFSQRMQQVMSLLGRVAGVDSTVLLLGESGVGKGLLARYLHSVGPWRDGAFVEINLGAVPESLLESELFGYEGGAFTGARKEGKAGLFELAAGGTLFLDEISELAPPLQVKLLSVLQERCFLRIGGARPVALRARVVAASNRDLKEQVRLGRFREDLYYRLNVVPVQIPPLRERRQDIPALIHHFLQQYNQRYGLTKTIAGPAVQAMIDHAWPGNVRELENLVERLVVVTEGEVVTRADLPGEVAAAVPTAESEAVPAGADSAAPVVVNRVVPLKVGIQLVEEQLLRQARARYGNTYEMARVLQIDQSTVVRKLHRHVGRQRKSAGNADD